MNDLHGLLFAYRADANLGELTRPRNTCSLPFGGRYRLIDFMLSNYVNAGISDVGIIVHQNYQSLLDHLGSGKDWDLSRKHGGLRILPPFGVAERGGSGEYRGNMEALAGIYTYLQNIRQEYVIMGWGDMVVNLPVAEVFQQHLDSGADITILCTQELKGAPRNTVYITQGPDGLVSDLSINPAHAANALESLETYIISKKLLLDMVDYCAVHNIHNFSRGVLLISTEAMWPASSPWPTTSSTPWTCWTQRCGRTCSILTAPSGPRTSPTPPPTTAQTPNQSTPWWRTAASSRARWKTPSSPAASLWRQAPRSPTAS